MAKLLLPNLIVAIIYFVEIISKDLQLYSHCLLQLYYATLNADLLH